MVIHDSQDLRIVSALVDIGSFVALSSQVGEAGLEVEVAPLEDEDGEHVAHDPDRPADRQQETLEPEERLGLH